MQETIEGKWENMNHVLSFSTEIYGREVSFECLYLHFLASYMLHD